MVFEDGSEGTLSADGDSYDDGLVYEYTVDSNGVATLSTPAPDSGKSGVVNGYVSTFAKGRNITLAKGDDPAVTRSYTVLSDADVWNVEGKPYEETLTSDMTVALVIDADGFVKTAFVKDTSVTKGTAAVVKDLGDKGVSIIGSETVFSGFKATFGGFAKNTTITVTYDVLKNNGRTETTRNKEIKSDANGYITIEMPKNATSVTLTAANNVVGGGETPTGKYTVSVYTSSNFAYGDFWVNGKNLTSSDVTNGAGYFSFQVNNTDKVELIDTAFATLDNNATVTLADGVTGTVNKNAGSVSFTVSKDFSLTAPASTIAGTATGGDVAPVVPTINTNLTLKTADGTVVSGGKVTKAEINTSNSSKLEISIALPEGYTSSNAATVTYVDSNSISKSITMAVGSTTTGVYTAASNSNESTTIGDGKGTLNITLEVSAITTKPVTYELPSGYTLDGTGTNTLNLDTATAGNLEFKLMGAPAYAAKVDVSYTVTGTNLDSAKTYTASGLAVTTGAVAQITVPSVKATGDVVVTVTEVKVTDVKAEIELADGVPASLIAFNGGTKTMTVGSAAKLANMDATLPTNVSKATVSYTVTGATGSKLIGTFEVDSSDASDKGWITDDFTPTGDQAVVVTIDSVTYTEAKNAAINTTALNTVDSGKTITVGVKTASSIKLQKSGDTYTNAEALTITLTPGSAWSAASVKIQLSGATNGSIADSANVVSTETSGSDTNPVEITFQAGELTFNDLSKSIQFVVEDN